MAGGSTDFGDFWPLHGFVTQETRTHQMYSALWAIPALITKAPLRACAGESALFKPDQSCKG